MTMLNFCDMIFLLPLLYNYYSVFEDYFNLGGLKKLLCCFWCKTQQQYEKADEYVIVQTPPRDEGEKDDGVHEESDSFG